MKKILYLITQSELGGAQRYILDLARALKGEYEITVAFGAPSPWNLNHKETKGKPFEQGELATRLAEENIPFHILPHVVRTISPLADIRAIFEIAKLIKKIRPDIVHLNSSKISILGSLACFFIKLSAKSYQLKAIYTVHGWVFNEPQARWKNALYKFCEKFTARFKDKIVCIDKLDYGIALEDLKLPDNKLSIIYHGLDLNRYNFRPREEARKALAASLPAASLPADSIIIGSIGNLYATKGFEYFIEAMEKVVSGSSLPIKAVIIGEGPEREELQKLISKKETLKGKIFLSGGITNAAELLPAFDYYLNTSVKEGFPYSILEAMAAGLPIVASEVGGIPDMITDRENGLLVAPKNSEAIATRLLNLMSDEDLRQALIEQAIYDARNRFTLGYMIEETKKLYSS
jgi:glycosyltransferase involved in cell wall biosynthesis